MGRRVEAAQLELGLIQHLCWHELPEASQAQAIELLTQLLLMVARVKPSGREASDEQ
jgi:hypothetical protein